MVDTRTRDSVLQVRDEAARRGIRAFFTLHREKSHLLRLGNNSVSLNTSEDLTRLDVEVLDGRRQSTCTRLGDLSTPDPVRLALERAVAQAAVAMPREYEPIEPVVERDIAEQPQYDAELEALDPATKVKTYERIMAAVGRGYNYSGSWSSGATELLLAGTASPAVAWHLGTDQHLTCVLKHPEERWELAVEQTGWRAGQVGAAQAIERFRGLVPVYAQPGWQVPPGEYAVAFGPQAIAELLALAVWTGFTGRGYEEKLGWTAGRRLGERILSERLTLVDDPAQEQTFRFGFDGTGMVRRRFPLVEAGKLAGLAYDLATAARYGRSPTPHAGSWSLAMAPGDGPPEVAAAVRDRERVLCIPALHYMNVPQRAKGIFTGSSRFSAVLLEYGAPARPLFSTRITDTFAKVFGNIETLAPTTVSVNLSNTYGRRQPEAASVPAYMVCSGVCVTDCADSF